jgi:hypothetical protein
MKDEVCEFWECSRLMCSVQKCCTDENGITLTVMSALLIEYCCAVHHRSTGSCQGHLACVTNLVLGFPPARILSGLVPVKETSLVITLAHTTEFQSPVNRAFVGRDACAFVGSTSAGVTFGTSSYMGGHA